MLSVSPSRGQTSVIDSLTNLLLNTTGKEHLAILKNLTNELEDVNPKKSIEFAQEGIVLADALKDSVSLVTFYASTAYSYTMLGDFSKALQRGFTTLALSEKIENKTSLATAHGILGITYGFMGQYSAALEHHFIALQIRKELGLPNKVVTTLNNIGVAYYNMGQYEKAIQYYQQAIESRVAISNDSSGIARFLDNLGLAQTKIGRFEEAKKNHYNAIAIAQRHHLIGGLSYSYLNLGIMYSDNEEYANAIEFLQRSLNLYSLRSQKYGMMQAYHELGKAYFHLQNNRLALKYLDSAIILAEANNVLPRLKESYEILSLLYERSGDTKKAFHYSKLFSAINDSLYTRKEKNKITELSVKLELAVKENVIDRLTKEAELSSLLISQEQSKRNFYWGIFIVLALGIPVSIIFYRRLNAKKKLIEEKHSALDQTHTLLEEKIEELQVLSKLIPICSRCKKVRDDHGFWEQVDEYFVRHSKATFSHALCPECSENLKKNMPGE